ncbi:Hypothetical_protein [Hexamita inflata]|uniref:Hypothetical_protein n=1 Tax=Hexamita inflata TaxID=28002 RepID=A0AA86UQ41_9EUKA|nr:Hypothetical protein HINF_LOCUS47927 [Hexamita inflata]
MDNEKEKYQKFKLNTCFQCCSERHSQVIYSNIFSLQFLDLMQANINSINTQQSIIITAICLFIVSKEMVVKRVHITCYQAVQTTRSSVYFHPTSVNSTSIARVLELQVVSKRN